MGFFILRRCITIDPLITCNIRSKNLLLTLHTNSRHWCRAVTWPDHHTEITRTTSTLGLCWQLVHHGADLFVREPPLGVNLVGFVEVQYFHWNVLHLGNANECRSIGWILWENQSKGENIWTNSAYSIHINMKFFKPRSCILIFKNTGNVYTSQCNHIRRVYENKVHFVSIIDKAPASNHGWSE